MKIEVSIDDLFKRQEDFVRSIYESDPRQAKIHIIRASRQSGKTYAILRLILLLIQTKNAYGGIVSASWDQYQELLSKFLEICPDILIKDI